MNPIKQELTNVHGHSRIFNFLSEGNHQKEQKKEQSDLAAIFQKLQINADSQVEHKESALPLRNVSPSQQKDVCIQTYNKAQLEDEKQSYSLVPPKCPPPSSNHPDGSPPSYDANPSEKVFVPMPQLPLTQPLPPVVNKNSDEAIKLYTKAANKGYAPAQCALGVCYENGIGVVKNLVEAIKLYTLAAKQGFAQAQHNLGVCYTYGNGVNKNPDEAFKLFTQAAKQGLDRAQHGLGFCYERGIGVEKNLVEAFKLYTQAAKQGLADAQFALGVCYERGIGVEKNYGEAVTFYILAANHGHAPARDRLIKAISTATQ